MNDIISKALNKAIADNIIIRNIEPQLPFYHIGCKMLSLLGYADEAELYKALDGEITNFIYSKDIPLAADSINKQLAVSQYYTAEYRIRKKDGSYIWVQDKGERVAIEDGSVAVLYTYCAATRCEVIADKEKYQLYDDVVSRSIHGIYVIEQQSHKLVYTNDTMNKILEHAGIRDYLGQTCYCALKHSDHPCEKCFAYSSDSTDASREVYLDFLSKHYSLSTHPIEWQGKQACVIYLDDISERKTAETELAKTKQKLTAAIDHAGIAYWEYDIANSIAYLNAVSTEEYALNEVITDYPSSLYATGAICQESVARYEALIKAVQNGEPSAVADIKTIDAKGELVWKRVKFTTLFGDDNKPFWAIATAESINEYKELESRFATVLEQNQIDTWMYDIQRHTIIQNHNTEDIYGIHGVEIPNVPDYLIDKQQCYHDDIDKFREFYNRLHSGDTQVSTTVRLWDIRVQSYVWKRCTYTLLPQKSGKLTYALGSAVDVTDQMEAKQKYENAIKYRYRTLGENVILAGHCNVTRNIILEVEDRTGLDVEHRFGMVREQFFTGFATLIPNEEQRQTFCKIFLNENIKNSFALGISQHDYECTISLGNDSNIRWISIHVDTAVQPETGELIGFLTVTDVSADKMQKQVLDAVIQFDYDFVAHLNLKSNTAVFYNSKSQMLQLNDFKYGEPYLYTDAIKHTTDRYITEEDKAVYAKSMSIENIMLQLKNKDSYEFTYHIIGENDEIRTKQTRFTVQDRAEGIVVFSRADVTDMLEQQEKQKIALADSLAIAQQANSSKSKFLSSMSHDIRTPMNAIVGMCSLAIADEQNTQQVHESLQVIEQSSSLLLSMITDILDMNRIESGKMVLMSEGFSFKEQLSLALGRARALAANKQQKVELEVNITHDYCNGDIIHIHRVMDNILANALKFTPKGGLITYRLTERLLEHKPFSIYSFEIQDTGIGIATEQQQHIFEPFYRAQNAMTSQIEGTGLGLSIVKSIVDYMGGTIKVCSVLNAGTTFTIDLPLRFADKTPIKQADTLPITRSLDLSRCNVLLCEDHPTNQLVAKRILEKAGVTVAIADNGQIGYEIFMHSKPNTFDAVLMDVQMPIMNGYDATIAIRACAHPQAKTVPIIAMTANAFAEDVQKSMSVGMNGHLAKPIEPNRLYELLDKFVIHP